MRALSFTDLDSEANEVQWMLRLTLYLGNIKLADQTGDKTDGWTGSHIYLPDCEVKIIFAKSLISAPVPLYITLKVLCQGGVSRNASSPPFPSLALLPMLS